MRLTLRTMLAYLDEQLDPPQMEEIGEKIRNSGIASAMIDRIRASVRKHRMEAPKLDGRGIGKDANSVAEYLDNVLDKDEIAELEKLCLESDMHLAEVAACHQMLAVLPRVDLEIDTRLRDRIYDIPVELREREVAERETEKREAVVKAKVADVKAPSQTKKKRKKKKTHRVPDYFKTPAYDSRRWLPLLLTAALLFVALGIGLFATRGQWMPRVAQNTTLTDADSKNAAGQNGDADALKQPIENDPAPSDAPPAIANGAGNLADDNNSDLAGPSDSAPPVPPVEENALADADSDADAMPADEQEEDALPVEPSVADSQPTRDREPTAPVRLSMTPTAVDGAPAVTWDAAAKGWRRTAVGERLPPDGLVQLIGTRLECKLDNGLLATIVGPSEVRFEPTPQGGDAVWVIDSGRLHLDAKEAGGARFRGLLGGRELSLKFISPDAQVALEAIRKVPAGADPADPEAFPPILVIDVLRGAVELNSDGMEQLIEASADGAAVEVEPDGSLRLLTQRTPPAWVEAQTAGETIKQAGRELLARLTKPQASLSVSLQEMASDRRVNVAALGAQALAQLGQIKPLCDQFREPQYKLYWKQNLLFLRQLMQASPANAEMVRGQLEEHFPSEAEMAYRILVSYTADQFAEEGRQLLGALESESLLLRVIAYQTLVELVGPRGGKYQPDDPPQTRMKHLSSWIEAFEAGKLKVRDEE